MENHYQLGYVMRAHGVTGGLRLKVDTDSPKKYTQLKRLVLAKSNQILECTLKTLQFATLDEVIVTVQEISDRTMAETWKSAEVWVDLSFLPPLKGKNQFYFHEVIGFEVKDTQLGLIGTVTSFYESLAHPIMAVDHQGKEVLIPIVDAFIVEVNHKEHYIATALPENWLEVYLD